MKSIGEILKQLKESLRIDPEGEISHLIPHEPGIYGWFNKEYDYIEYIGRAVGEGGLNTRIVKQHLNPIYLLYNESKWSKSRDLFQIEHAVIIQVRRAIDKSAFRKNVSRVNNLIPGKESVNYIKRNFWLRFLIFNDKDEIKNIEKQLIKITHPIYNETVAK
jgi:excinuclease UvrABC nuclease subunit